MFLVVLALGVAAGAKPKQQECQGRRAAECSPLQEYVNQMEAGNSQWRAQPASGSLYAPGSRMAELGRDFRALFAGDTVTVITSDRTTAVAKGTTNTSRKSNASANVSAALGPLRATGPLGKLIGAEADTQLQGQGETARSMQLSTVITAVVERVLPNGNLLLRGSREISVNAERQLVEIRGIIRPEDLQAGNTISSDRIAMLEVRINGKGVVADSVRRPMFLYRLLLGLLPF